MTNLPPRFREDAFKRYASCIADIVSSWPNAVEFNPARLGLSSVTFACRLRDAIESFSVNRWPSARFDPVRFDEIRDKIYVSESVAPGFVVAGDREHVRQGATVYHASPGGPTAPVDVDTQMPTLTLLGWLAHNRVLAGAVRLTNVTPESSDYLRNNFDVSITDNGDGTYTLL